MPKGKNCVSLVQLRDAIKQRNRRQANKLLKKITIIDNKKCKSVHTLIHWAILKFQDVEILKALINRGADVYAKNGHQETPLKLAVQKQHIKATKLLLNNKAYVGEDFQLLAEVAIEQNSEKLIKILTECGIKHNLFPDLNDLLDLVIINELPALVKIIIPHCKIPQEKQQISEVAILLGGDKYTECLNILLQHGFHLNAACKENYSLAFESAKCGYLPIMKEFLSIDFDIHLVNEVTGLNLLHTACYYKQHKIAEFCLNQTIDVNSFVLTGSIVHLRTEFSEKLRSLVGKTSLYIAMKNADSKMLDILLNHGAYIPYDPEFISVMNDVIQQDNLEILKVFIAHGFNVNARLPSGRTLLHECARCQTQPISILPSQLLRFESSIQYRVAELLIKNGADVNSPSLIGDTPLFVALRSNFMQMVEFLIDNNANIYHKNLHGNTPLHYVAQSHWISTDILIQLLKYKIDINEKNDDDITPLHHASLQWNVNLVQILLDHGADISCKDDQNRQPLHFAAESQNLEVAELLLKNGANIHDLDINGRTPLHTACNQYDDLNVDFLKLFLQYGANINANDIHKQTPLFFACKRGNLNTVKTLLMYGARPNHVDLFGIPPIHFTAENFRMIFRYLMGRKSTITSYVTKEGKTLLHALVEEQSFDLIREYIQTLNVHINTPDYFGKTPLYYAASLTDERTLVFLLENGADINSTHRNRPTIPMVIYERMIHINYELEQVLNELRENYNEFDNYLRLRRQYFPQRKTLREYKRILHLMRQHLIKLKTAKMSIHPQNLPFSIYHHRQVDIHTDYTDAVNLEGHEILYKLELRMLKITRIPNTQVSLYNILMSDTRTLANHVNLITIKSFLKRQYLAESFPMYIGLIKYHVSNALRRRKWLNLAHIYSESSIFFGLPIICTNKIFDYLDNTELRNFNHAVGIVRCLCPEDKEDLSILLQTDSNIFVRGTKPNLAKRRRRY